MGKRKAEVELDSESKQSPAKRQKRSCEREFLDLSDELLLRILSYLRTTTLTRCERVCKKLELLSKDNELWKKKYFEHFVLPRARRNPAFQSRTTENDVVYSSRAARWLENSKHSSNKTASTQSNWKHLFKIKRNWECGRAKKTELVLDEEHSPSVIAKVVNGNLYTCDAHNGVRVFSHGKVIASSQQTRIAKPTTLDVETIGTKAHVVVGYEDGLVLILEHSGSALINPRSFNTEETVAVSSLAIAWPYLATMTRSKGVTVYSCGAGSVADVSLLATSACESSIAPSSISLRKTKESLVAGIVYAFDSFNAGWCLGLQEIRMNLSGLITGNRTTSSISNSLREHFKHSHTTSRSATTSPFSLHPDFQRPPTSLSYSGCYILAGLPDNTLMVYTVSSTDDKLEINVGRRLWGHTSAVAAAEVTSNGKAVSISAKSDEMRYWELEDLLSSNPTKTSTLIQCSVSDAIKQRGTGIGLAWPQIKDEAEVFRRQISFDDSQAVVVGARGYKQVISCFTFA